MIECGECRKCCQWGREGKRIGAIITTKEVMSNQYEFTKVASVFRLNVNHEGDCIYLGEKGCTIHDTKPEWCRTFDCRELFTSTEKNPFLRILCEGALRSQTKGEVE